MKRAKETLLDKSDRIMSDIGILNDITLNVTDEIIAQIILQKKSNVVISKTANKELLFYREIKGGYNNIMVDEDGDVSVLLIRNGDSSDMNPNSYFYSLSNGLDYKLIVEFL